MLKRFASRFGSLIDLTPREVWRLMRGRVPLIPSEPAWTAMDLLASAKHSKGIRFAELLMRQEAIAGRAEAWKPFDFNGRAVVEVGCGPLAGFGPLAIFCGAKSYTSAEPEWCSELFASEAIAARYLFLLHTDLCSLYGQRMSFKEFRKALAEKISVHKSGFESAPISERADIILSQSCLEHVFPLKDTIARLAELQGPSTRFMHLVDFGNHYISRNPFDGMYEEPPQAYIARRGKAINMLRVSDISAAFEQAGIPVVTLPTRFTQDTFGGTIHQWWRERYDDEALFTQHALLISRGA